MQVHAQASKKTPNEKSGNSRPDCAWRDMRTAALLLLLRIPTLAADTFAKIRAELPHRTAAGAYVGSIAWGHDRADARLENLYGEWVLAG